MASVTSASVASLVEQGNVALSQLEPELAGKLFHSALLKSPNDTSIMDQLADICIQLGNNNDALNYLLNSTKIAPKTNPVKWLYLAQLKQEHEALNCYNTGIKHLEESIQEKQSAVDICSSDDNNNNNSNKQAISNTTAATVVAVDHDNDENSSTNSITSLRNIICKAYCGIAELYLTDLW